MRVLVNGVRLFFEANGARLVPGGPTVREKPGSHCPPIDVLYRDGTAGGIKETSELAIRYCEGFVYTAIADSVGKSKK
jgi:hypothetical protein